MAWKTLRKRGQTGLSGRTVPGRSLARPAEQKPARSAEEAAEEVADPWKELLSITQSLRSLLAVLCSTPARQSQLKRTDFTKSLEIRDATRQW